MPEGANETISIRVIGDARSGVAATRQTVSGLKQVEAQSKHTSSATKAHAEEAVAANALLTGSFRSMARQAVVGGAAFAAAYIGISKAKNAIAATEELAHQTLLLHRNLGLTVQTASALSAVLKARGIDANSAAMAFQTLSRQVIAAETGSKKTIAAFQALGITQKDLKAAGGDLNVLLPKIADGFGNMKGGTERAAVAQALLARGYKSLLPLFTQGSKGFNDQIAAAQKYGAVLDGKTLRQQEELIKSQRALSLASLGLKVSFTQAATPAIEGLSRAASKAAIILHGPGSFDSKLQQMSKVVAPAFKAVETEVERAIPKVADAAGRAAPKVAESFVTGFLHADIWGQLFLGAFLVRRLGGWRKLFAAAGLADATAWGEAFTPAAEAEAGATGKTAGARYSAGFRKALLAGIAAGLTIDLYKGLVGPFNQALQDLFGQINGSDPTNGNGQANADKRAGNLPPTYPFGKSLPGLMPIPKGAKGASYRAAAITAAQQAGIDPNTFLRQIQQESGFNPNARSGAGAIGIAQLMPATAKSLGVDPRNPIKSLYAAADLMASYVRKYGSIRNALIAYNAGPGTVGHALPAETQKYLAAILGPSKAGGGKSYLDYLNAAGGGSSVTKKPGNDPRIEAMSLNNALAWIKKHYGIDVTAFVENKGGANQHLHVQSVNHHDTRSIAEALNKMGFSVGEYGGKPIPGIGGITTLKHKHYGAADHYHGGAIDVNADGLLIRTFGGGPVKPKTPIFRVPSITQADMSGFLQGKLDHFDLMVSAGLMSQTAANAAKRKAIEAMLGLLRGDAKLQALTTLRGIPVPTVQTPAQKTWTQANLRNLLVGYGNKNPGFIPDGGWAALGQDRTLNNPFLQAFLGHADARVGAGELTGAAGDALKIGALQRALPFASGDDALAIKGLLKQIADNTKDAAHALAQADISDAGFLGGLSGAGQSAVGGVLSQYGITNLPGGGLISALLGNPAGASGLATADIGSLMGEVTSGKSTFADVWPLIRADLGVIADGTTATANNTQDLSDFWKQRAYSLAQGLAISQSQYGVFGSFNSAPTPFLGGFDSGGIVPGPRGQAGYALVHGGETVLPTHKGGQVPIQIILSASAQAAGVMVDHNMGRNARQLSVAPGR